MRVPFVHHFIRIFAPTIFLSVIVVNGAQNLVGGSKSRQQNTVKKSEPKPADFFSKNKMELVKELDDVMREMIWLIRSERPSANKTLFGKVYRALQQAKGGKLTEKSKHTCDQYQLEKVSEYQYRVFEYCQKHRNPDLLAKIDWSQSRVAFQFQGQNYADILGGAAALVAPVIDCAVTIEGESRLSELYCAGFRITRAENVVRFSSIGYKKGKDPMMVMKGEVLKNLLPYSDLMISVPLSGKVQVLEKKKVPDADETTPAQKEKEKQKAEEIAKKPSEAPAPVDPRKPVEKFEPVYIDPAKVTAPPRESERPNDSESTQQNPNNTLLKNVEPDVIEIQENQPVPQPLPPPPSR
tara:strand:- start:28340 stop:29398 length:1059 start_codon:yes stop_codon:yes gene_type:complete